MKFKKQLMQINKSDQFLEEIFSWIRLIDFYKEEISYLKTRLSEVVDQNINNDLLPSAEYFQNLFIVKDEFNASISSEIKNQELQLHEIIKNNTEAGESFLKKQEKLRNEIENFEKKFNTSKKEFNKFLFSIV